MNHKTVDHEKTHNHIRFGVIQSDCDYLRAQFDKCSGLNPKQLQAIPFIIRSNAVWI